MLPPAKIATAVPGSDLLPSMGGDGRPGWCRPGAGSPSEEIQWWLAVVDGSGIVLLLTLLVAP
jgi:hypothetical protein